MSNSILEGELIVKEESDIILNKEKVFRSSFRSSVRETGAVLSFPGLNCTFYFMDGKGAQSFCSCFKFFSLCLLI